MINLGQVHGQGLQLGIQLGQAAAQNQQRLRQNIEAEEFARLRNREQTLGFFERAEEAADREMERQRKKTEWGQKDELYGRDKSQFEKAVLNEVDPVSSAIFNKGRQTVADKRQEVQWRQTQDQYNKSLELGVDPVSLNAFKKQEAEARALREGKEFKTLQEGRDLLNQQRSKAINSPLGLFGGQPIDTTYSGAKVTVFGGGNDPADNGLSAFGGKTGKGGKEGVAIPADILRATLGGSKKDWDGAQVVVEANGIRKTVPLVDLGTAEWVWEREGRPVLDMTPGVIQSFGGQVIEKDGKMVGASGIDNVSFSIIGKDGVEQKVSGQGGGMSTTALNSRKKAIEERLETLSNMPASAEKERERAELQAHLREVQGALTGVAPAGQSPLPPVDGGGSGDYAGSPGLKQFFGEIGKAMGQKSANARQGTPNYYDTNPIPR